MKIDRVKWRFCKAIACERRKGLECEAKECEHPDTDKALAARREQLKVVKHG